MTSLGKEKIIVRQKFEELINMGADIEFSYNGKHYTLLAWIPEGISVGEQDNDEDDNIFSDFDDMLKHYVIDGVKFADIIDDVNIEFSS